MSDPSDPTTPTKASDLAGSSGTDERRIAIVAMLPTLDYAHVKIRVRRHTLPISARCAEET